MKEEPKSSKSDANEPDKGFVPIKNEYAINFEFDKDVHPTDAQREYKKELWDKIQQWDREMLDLNFEMTDLKLLFYKKKNQYTKLHSEKCDFIKEMIKLDEKFAKAYEIYKEFWRNYTHEY